MPPAAAWAAGKPFDQAGFEAAQAAGKPILVEVHADWCPTCRAQEPIISRLMQDPKHSGFVVLRVDFDNQKDVVKRLHTPYQSTLIVFKGKKVLGGVMALLAIVVLTGLDKTFEAWVLDVAPAWLTQIGTSL